MVHLPCVKEYTTCVHSFPDVGDTGVSSRAFSNVDLPHETNPRTAIRRGSPSLSLARRPAAATCHLQMTLLHLRYSVRRRLAALDFSLSSQFHYSSSRDRPSQTSEATTPMRGHRSRTDRGPHRTTLQGMHMSGHRKFRPILSGPRVGMSTGPT